MLTSKNIDKICVAVIVIALIVTILFMNGASLGITPVVDEDAESYTGTAYFTANDQNGTWSTASSCVITLNGTGADIKGNGAYYNDGSVTIKNGGSYVISGSLEDGSIIVDAYVSSKVWIMLDNVEINCEDDACIIVDQADKVFLTLAEGSVNTLTSGGTYSSQALEDNTGGVIFSHDDLTINGSGTLNITGSYKHGIDANDSLHITGGTINITCPQDGLHVNDEINIMGADISIAAGDDGIHSDTAFYIASGTILISECYEGIEAITIDMDGGDVTIYPSDDGLNANGGSDNAFGGGMHGGGMHGGGTDADGGGSDTSSGESTAGATFDGRPDMTDNAPDMTDNSGMTDNAPDMTNGNGMPGGRPDMADGNGMPDNSDMPDGAANSADADGDASQESSAEDSYIKINGGTLTIINETGRDADGIDSNGSIYINGGTIMVSLTGSGGNCALDYGSESGGILQVNGGTLIAAGDSSMVEAFSETGSQCAVLYNMEETAEAGTEFTVTDAGGNVILSGAPATSYNSVGFSCSEMTVGGTYTITVGDTTEEITLESTSTTLGTSSGMGGHGGMMNGQDGTMERPDGMKGGRGSHDHGRFPDDQSETSDENTN